MSFALLLLSTWAACKLLSHVSNLAAQAFDAELEELK